MSHKIHCLKCWVGIFDDMRLGLKPFEYRMNDRDFAVGDCLVLQEYNPEYDSLTGENYAARVTYLLPGGKFGVPANYCIMGVEPWVSPSVSGDQTEAFVVERTTNPPVTEAKLVARASEASPKCLYPEEHAQTPSFAVRFWTCGCPRTPEAVRPCGNIASVDGERCVLNDGHALDCRWERPDRIRPDGYCETHECERCGSAWAPHRPSPEAMAALDAIPDPRTGQAEVPRDVKR